MDNEDSDLTGRILLVLSRGGSFISEFEQRLWQGFDHKNVPAVLGIYLGFAKRKVNIPAIPWPQRGCDYK